MDANFKTRDDSHFLNSIRRDDEEINGLANDGFKNLLMKAFAEVSDEEIEENIKQIKKRLRRKKYVNYAVAAATTGIILFGTILQFYSGNEAASGLVFNSDTVCSVETIVPLEFNISAPTHFDLHDNKEEFYENISSITLSGPPIDASELFFEEKNTPFIDSISNFNMLAEQNISSVLLETLQIPYVSSETSEDLIHKFEKTKKSQKSLALRGNQAIPDKPLHCEEAMYDNICSAILSPNFPPKNENLEDYQNFYDDEFLIEYAKIKPELGDFLIENLHYNPKKINVLP